MNEIMNTAITRAAEKYGNDILSYVKLCGDSNEDFIKGVENTCEESFIAGVEWALKNLMTEKGGAV